MGKLADGEGVTFSAELASGLGITEASGTVTIEALAPTNDKSRCYDDNIDRDTPVAVTVKADVSAATGYVPAPADAGGIKSVSFNVVCPAVQEASSTQGQELVPENPFPTDR